MKYLRDLLLEIMDKPYDFKKSPPPVHMNNYANNYANKFHKYEFSSPQDNYKVNLYHDYHNIPNHMNVEFTSDSAHLGKSKIEGASSHKVFATVHHIIRQHMNKHPDQTHVVFSSSNSFKGGGETDEGSRTKLYRHMARRITGVKKGEPNKHEESDLYGDNSETEFKIHKKDVV